MSEATQTIALKPARRIFVAVLTYTGWLHYQTVGSLDAAHNEAHQRGWTLHTSLRATDSIITRARNALLAEFIKSGCDDMLFVDHDIAWANGVFSRIMSHDVDVVAGVYRPRKDPEDYVVRPLKGWLAYDESGNGLMEVEAAPTGFLRISRKAALALVEAHADEWYEDLTCPGLRIHNIFDFQLIGHEYWSEDYVFCRRWRDLGGKVWIDPDLPLSHCGDKVFSGCFGEFLRRRLAEQQAEQAAAQPASPLDAARKLIAQAKAA